MGLIFSYSSGEFPAQVLRSRTAGGFVCTETDYLPKQAIGKHSHNTAGLVAALRGGFTERLGARQFVCEPLSVLYRAPGDVHTDDFGDTGGKCLTIEIPKDRFLQMEGIVPGSTRLVSKASPSIDFVALRLYREFREDDPESSLALEGLILELLAGVSRHFTRTPQKRDGRSAQCALELIRDRWIEGLTLSGIAEEVGVHPNHLARAFREEFGVTIGEYIRGLRLRRSAEELAGSDKPLSRIATECGFSDQSHFTRTFKKATGETPLEYRRSSRGR